MMQLLYSIKFRRKVALLIALHLIIMAFMGFLSNEILQPFLDGVGDKMLHGFMFGVLGFLLFFLIEPSVSTVDIGFTSSRAAAIPAESSDLEAGLFEERETAPLSSSHPFPARAKTRINTLLIPLAFTVISMLLICVFSEILQAALTSRVFDEMDIVANIHGAAIGFVMAVFCDLMGSVAIGPLIWRYRYRLHAASDEDGVRRSLMHHGDEIFELQTSASHSHRRAGTAGSVSPARSLARGEDLNEF